MLSFPRKLALASLIVGLVLSNACAEPSSDEELDGELDNEPAVGEDDPAADEADLAAESQDKIWRGTLGTDRTVVAFGPLNDTSDGAFTCSGAALSSRIILTAGHCLPANSKPASECGGFACNRGSMRLYRPTATLAQNVTDLRSVRTYRHESLSVPNPEYDIGLIVLDTPWYSMQSVNLALSQLSKGSVLQMRGGFGTISQYERINTGFLSRPRGDGRFGIDWTNGLYFIDDNDDDVQTCKGDSGAPAFYQAGVTGAIPSVAAVASGGDFVGSRLCVVGGEKVRWTAVNPKLPWIRARIRANNLCPDSGPNCCVHVAFGTSARCY